jgi:hypothetical protein
VLLAYINKHHKYVQVTQEDLVLPQAESCQFSLFRALRCCSRNLACEALALLIGASKKSTVGYSAGELIHTSRSWTHDMSSHTCCWCYVCKKHTWMHRNCCGAKPRRVLQMSPLLIHAVEHAS